MNESCLLFDATNRWIVCGLFADEAWHTRAVHGPGLASSKLAPMIGEMLAGSGLERPDWIVAARGPGSFTGARLTVSTARNLAQFWDVPVMGVESLAFYAYVCSRDAATPAGRPIGVLVDGKQNRVFARLIRPGTSPDEWQAESVLDVSPGELRDLWGADTLLFADDETAVRKYLGGKWAEANFRPLPQPNAQDLHALALALGGPATAGSFAELLPVYARPDPAQAKYPDGYTPVIGPGPA